MKKEYDFSNAERGKFYSKGAKMEIPIYLEGDAMIFVQEIAKRKHMDISSTVNKIIRSDMKLAEAIR